MTLKSRIALIVLVLAGLSPSSAGAEANHRQLLSYHDANGRAYPVKEPEEWAKRRAAVLLGMQEAMGPLPDRSNVLPLDVTVIEEKPGDGFTRVQLTFVAEKADRVPALLYLPANRKPEKRSPAMLALHQTAPGGKRDLAGEGKNPNMGYAPELARRGYVVLCPDYPSFGDYTYDFAADDYVSGTMKGIVNHMRCVDLLHSRDDVDPERIGVIGHSLGGHNALFVAAFDTRLKVVVTSCGWTPFHDYYGGKIEGWTSDRYMPRLRDVYKLDPDRAPFDFYEVIAALAPRHVFSSSPLHDENFAVVGVRKADVEARKVFELLGARDNLKVIYPDCGHDFPPAVRKEAFAFIDRALKHAPPEPEEYGAELPRIPPTDPADALKTFKVHPGFRIEQVAAEPMVQSPVAMAFDENGRLFVVEMRDYSEEENDRLGVIKLLEDSDGDGRFDRHIVFADDLSWPTAIACYDGGVFVGAAPDIYFLKDTDGDGTADVRKTVFTGFKRHNVQGLLNSFHWTLDNRIHGATSTCGGDVCRADVPDAKPVNLNGRDFSFDPRTLDLRPESGGAQHGLTFDDWGRKFVCANSDHIQMVMYEDRVLAHHPHVTPPPPRQSIAADGPQAKVFRISPVEPWRIVRTRLRVAGVVPGPIEGGGTPAGYFTGATGTTIYRGDAFPLEFRGQAFIGDVGSNIIHRKVLEPSGVGFIAKRVDAASEFVASTDTWFRPAQFANGPDGALHVIDVYREVIEHPASLPPQIKKHLDLRSGADRGRIYRIVPDGFKQRPPRRLGRATTEELVRALEHPNGWHRDTAARLLFERQDKAAVSLLVELAKSSPSALGRIHALYALRGLDALDAPIVLTALSDPEARVREHAVQLAPPEDDVRRRLASMADDTDVRVRYQLAFTLGTIPTGDDTAATLRRILITDGADPYVRFAAMSAYSAGTADLVHRLATDEQLLRSAPARAMFTELARQAGTAARSDEVAAILSELDTLARHDRELAAAVLLALRDGLASARSPLLDEVARDTRATELLAAAVASARDVAADSRQPATHRTQAIRTLTAAPFDTVGPVFGRLLVPTEPHEVQLAALRALDAYDDNDDDGVGGIIARAWPSLSPRVRSAAADVLFARPQRLAPVLDAAEKVAVPFSGGPSEKGTATFFGIDAARLRLLEGSGADPALIERTRRLLGGTVTAAADTRPRDDLIRAFRPALEMKGDPANGRALFQKACAGCHRLDGTGHEIGPNLAAVQNRGAEAILVNVLDPNREVNPQYVEYIVQTKDGRTLSGLLAAETDSSVMLRRAEDLSDTVRRSDIKRMRAGKVSIMPEGLEAGMDAQAVADLIAYIMSVK